MDTQSWKDGVVSGFDAAAHQYDGAATVQKQAADNLIRLAPAVKAPDILEIGCGTGALSRMLVEKYPDAFFHFTDLSPSMIFVAQLTTDPENVRWDVMDGENPVLEKKYDLIFANMVFQWFEDRGKAIERLAGHLKPGGRILYSQPGPESFHQWKDTLRMMNMPCGLLEFERPVRVVEENTLDFEYGSGFDFLKSLKAVGAHKPKSGYTPLGPRQLKQACRTFDDRHKGRITWHLQYGEYAV